MAIHHKIPQSRGGSDDEWNLVEVDSYTHAYEHALDFVLFEQAPVFDCRQPGWNLIPDGLREAVKSELSNRMIGNQRAVGYGGPTGERNGNYGKAPCLGRVRPESERRAISEKLTGKPKSAGHRQKLSEACTGKKKRPQAPNNPRRIAGAYKGWETRRRKR